MRGFVLVMCASLSMAATAAAQTVERRGYVMSSSMHHALDERDFNSGRIEQIVNGISQGLDGKNLGPILEAASPSIRITDGATNKVVNKEQLAKYKDKLFKDPALRSALTDESQFILKSDSVGLARGTFWITEDCLDDACNQKKTSIATVNLP